MFKSKNIIITGGASGIGRIMAREFLKRGATVIVWDMSQPNIEATNDELSSLGSLKIQRVDITDTSNIKMAAEELRKELGDIDIIINNAGVVVGGSFAEQTIENIDRVMKINTNGAMYVTHEFLGDMIRRDSGYICNIASSAGTISNPNMSVYVASKWATFGWSDSLRLELKRSGSKVGVTTILPYYINTGMFDGVESRIPILKPEHAARVIIESIEHKRPIRSIYSWMYNTTRFMQGLLPSSWVEFILDKVFRIYNTMDHFTGRK